MTAPLNRLTVEPYPRDRCCYRCHRSHDPDTREPFKLDKEHDHATGDFRGWVCARCNALIAYAEHALSNPEEYQITLEYLYAAKRRNARARFWFWQGWPPRG